MKSGLLWRRTSIELKWWRLSQRIRSFSEIPIEAVILDTGGPPIYQQVASKAFQLQQLGMSSLAIARRLGVTDKTVAKAVAWFRRAAHGAGS
jgi:hypothetical protein